MRTKETTLSFPTESKASAVRLSSMRRVAMTLLVMLLTTASVWAQEGPVIPTPKITKEIIPMNGGTVTVPEQAQMGTRVQFTVTPYDGYRIKSVSLSDPGIYSLAGSLETGHYSFTIGASDVTITVVFKESDEIEVTNSLKYVITNEAQKQAELSGYEEDKPKGTLNIPATVTINGTKYSVTSIGNYAFENCSSLQSVTIPKSVTSIGDCAFSGCSNLQSVTIPNSVTSIGDNAFKDCSSLQSVTIPNSVTTIGVGAFEFCSNLQSVTIPNSVTSIGNCAFWICSSLESVTIPNSVTSIGDCAFSWCSNLQSVTIPNSVTSIGNNAFSDCSILQSVTIPNSVTSIGNDAFSYCPNLQSVTINGNPKIGTDAFLVTPATVTMNLTASEIDGDYWTTFYNDGYYNFQTDENTTVYKGTVNESSLMLTEVEDKIVNSGTAVILKSSGNPVMTLTETGSSDTNGNDLRGISDRDLRTSVISNFSANEIYTMGNTSVGFGFHRYTGEYVPAGKAFLPLNTSNGAKAQSLSIIYAIGTTGINSVSSDSNVQNDWFSLDGTRLSGKPSQPGIYVNGKKKVVIK